MTQAAQHGPVSLSEAARIVGVHKSTLSRDLAKGLFPNHGSHAVPLVDVREVVAGRSRGIDIAMRRQAPAVDQFGGLFDAEPMATTRLPIGADATLANERIRKTRAEADRAELDNAERQGALCDRAEVEAAALDLGTELRNMLENRVHGLAQRLVGQPDQKSVMRILEEDVRDVLAGLAERLSRVTAADHGHDDRVAA